MTLLDRRRLGAVVALALGAFALLMLLPLPLTGALGATLGPALWSALGLGALGVPLVAIAIGLAGFDRLPRLDQKRAAILVLALALLVPYAIAVVAQVTAETYGPDRAAWTWSARLSGWLPGFFARSALDSIGLAGGLIAGFVVLTGVTLGTLAWHPLRRLERRETPLAADPAPVRSIPEPVMAEAEPVEDEPVDEPDETPLARWMPSKGKAKKAKAEPVQEELPLPRPPRASDDALPPLDLLTLAPQVDTAADTAELKRLGELLLATMKTFKVEGTLNGITSGPTVSQFEVVPAAGVKAGRIVALADDLAITMRAQSLRVAPIPGRGAVGVEIPNPTPRMVALRELLASEQFQHSSAVLPIALGRDVEGKPVVADLAKMPHLLVAGATGSGKSVAINTIVTSLVYRYSPRELRFLMIDPKMVELSMYHDLPHLRHKVVTDNNDAAAVLKWAVYEMNRRYELLHVNGARQLADFNRKVREGKPLRNPPSHKPTLSQIAREAPDTPPQGESAWTDQYTEGELPMIVVLVDELADLMMTVQGEIETPLAMLAQKARAIGIHLVLATQRPSVNVLTGLIKANFPSRMAFRVASKVDSRTILDQNGAEALLGNGDMLFLPPGRNEPQRIQGAYISTEETERLMAWYEARRDGITVVAGTEPDILELVRAQSGEDGDGGGGASGDGERDPLFRQAAETCIQHQGGSTSLLQRRLGIGYGRAARIIDQLHDQGILGPPNGSKPREILIGMHQLEEYS
ncbi:MAG TPA: DNA translocase FtsK [Gemmatimonadales bacterium]|nr:DNA translocase FtsK [Gemmatimonadales bacterium]